MITATYNILQFTRYKDIPNWSVQYQREEELGFTQRYPMARIGSFLVKSRDVIEVQDDIEYKQVTLKINNGGVVPRNNGTTIIGSKIGTKKQTVIHSGQFIMSKIDARNGAYGIVPDNLEGAIVTNDFPVFDTDESKILPQFLVLISTTEQFLEFARKCSSGTTNRKRIDIDAFLQQAIPLPGLGEQKEILDAYYELLKSAEEKRNLAKEFIEEVNDFLCKQLHFSCKKNTIRKGLNFIQYAAVDRWDVTFIGSIKKVESSCPVIKVEDCLSYFMKDERNGSLRTETYKTPDAIYNYIGMENVEKASGQLLSLPQVLGKQIKSQTVFVPKGYFIYGKLRPYLNKYWENNTERDNIVCSSEFFCFKIKDTLNKDYFRFILSSYIIQEQISESMSGARMPRINEEVFKNILIPLPSIDVQNKIAQVLLQKQNDMLRLTYESTKLVEKAFHFFSNKLFESPAHED